MVEKKDTVECTCTAIIISFLRVQSAEGFESTLENLGIADLTADPTLGDKVRLWQSSP